MGAWAVANPQSGTGLTRQFALLSLLVIGLITAAFSLVTSYYLRKNLLEREWRVTADFIRSEATYHLEAGDFEAPGTPAARARFEAFYRQAVLLPEIVRVKVYDADMAVVWSDEPRLFGQRFPDNLHLASALAGRTVVNVEAGEQKLENVYERDGFPELVEVYVPLVFPGGGRVAGVVETYKAPTQVLANIRQSRVTVFGTAVAGGAFLYLSLFWMVRRAARRLGEQHQALRAIQAQLLEAERMAAIGEVTAAVAHGIRNPLANIRASAQVASLDCAVCARVPGTGEHLANIMAEVDRLEARLKELLQFVRPAERPTAPVDLNAAARSALHMVAARAAKAGVTVEERLSAALPPVGGDRMLIEQILLSLLENAVEAIPGGGGTVTVVSGTSGEERDRPRPFVEVRDTGPGIPADDLGRIFQAFYTTKAQGTGLGLAIARKFTEAHGGAISVESRPGEGTAFRVTFPAGVEP